MSKAGELSARDKALIDKTKDAPKVVNETSNSDGDASKGNGGSPPIKTGGTQKKDDIDVLVKKYSRKQSEAIRKEMNKNHTALSEDLIKKITAIAEKVDALSVPAANAHMLPVPVAGRQSVEFEKDFTSDMPSDDGKFEDGNLEPSEESDDEVSLGDMMESKAFKQRVSPSAETVQVWAKARKITEDYDMDEWKKTTKVPSILKYTAHLGARCFKAPAVDSEVPNLKYKDQKESEKKVVSCTFLLLIKDFSFRLKMFRLWLALLHI